MEITERIAAASDALTDAERDILTDIAGLPDAAYLSAAQIAQRSSVHETTVTRLARKLGYSGFREFRAALRGQTARSDRLLEGRARPRGGDLVLGSYLRDEADALLRLADLISEEQLARVATILARSDRVFVMGVAALVDCLTTRLRRVGIDAHGVVGTERQVAERLVGVREGDAVFAFAVRPAGPMFVQVMEHLALRGARFIVASDVVGMTLPVVPEELMTVVRGADDDFRTLVVPTALCYAIELSLYRLDTFDAQASLAEMDRISDLLHRSGRKSPRRQHHDH